MAQSSQTNTQPDRSGLRNRRTNAWNPSQRNVPDIHPQEQPGHHMNDIRPRRERTRQDDYLYYSLSGPPAPPPRYDQHQTYYDEGYLDVNPWMRQEDDGPNFTLARNFPRIVRWKGVTGVSRLMRRGRGRWRRRWRRRKSWGRRLRTGMKTMVGCS